MDNLVLRPPDGLKLTGPQRLWLWCLMRHAAFIGGYGSGKTFILVWKALMLATMHRGCDGVILSPTYRMLKDTVMVVMEEVLESIGLSQYVIREKSDMRLVLPNGSGIFLRSAEKPERVRGLTLAWALLDEATLIRDLLRLLNAVGSRLRDPRAACCPRTGRKLYHLGLVGTPEGVLDDLYEMFFRAPHDPAKLKKWKESYWKTQSPTYLNPAAPVGGEYMEFLELNVSESMQAAHIEGKYIDLKSGVCYHDFQLDRNVTELARYNPNLDLLLSWDFNLDPMVCLVAQRRGNNLAVIDEIGLKHSNTPEVCRVIARKYGIQGFGHTRDIYIYGDATGGKGTAEMTDYETIMAELQNRFVGELIRRWGSSNPTHKKRIRAVNAKLSNARGKPSLFIHPQCRRVLRDLQRQVWSSKDHQSKDKQQIVQGETLGHASDCLDYLVVREWPWFRNVKETPETLRHLTRWEG